MPTGRVGPEHDFKSAYPSGLLPEVALWVAVINQEAITARRLGKTARAFLRCPPRGPLERILQLLGVELASGGPLERRRRGGPGSDPEARARAVASAAATKAAKREVEQVEV